MKKLVNGERQATVGVLLGLLALVAVGAGVLLFALDARKTAKDSQALAREAVVSEQALRQTLIERCVLGEAQRQDAREDLMARIRQLEALITADTELKQVAPETRIFDMRIKAYADALAAARDRLTGLGEPVRCDRLYGIEATATSIEFGSLPLWG